MLGAFLTIVGYSINDTVVIDDRIRFYFDGIQTWDSGSIAEAGGRGLPDKMCLLLDYWIGAGSGAINDPALMESWDNAYQVDYVCVWGLADGSEEVDDRRFG